MSTYTHITTWMVASRQEALLARHLRIEQTDLLLGLLAQGGSVAQTLGEAGATLAGARRAAADLDDADLAQAGITGSARLRPARLPAASTTALSTADLDWAPDAEEILFERKGRVRSDRQALEVMLQDGRAPATRLLQALGVDVAALRERLAHADAPSSTRAVPVALAPEHRRQGMEHARRCSHFISAPADLVRGLLSDPDRLGQWWWRNDAEVLETGVRHAVVEHRHRRRSVRMRYLLSQSADGGLAWREEALTVRYAGVLVSVRELRAQETAGGTLLHLTLVTRSLGPLGRLTAPLARLWVAMGMRHQLLLVAALVADETTG
ncbi:MULTISPECIES: Clp protease N-terminal domain-containing protein [unclassified Actinomyces]|uniref:Clp protease N-terminal domain-containing protein n=1 Tax=unclassified Actinomyces TaxID=2609248 RepID=UPI002016E375|nr:MULTISPECIES: Clp protease N-terminal domain-containing protein [unclassified Actinomyces]MCL3778731.1 hypothetical protein [Actinomyces sp. AC-20-1]MCL3790226.1 hypothetical protein [Actinomyces sp. 187325]MCL3792533.1 hypothetical protein [Actinomyces sp. 186855]MCL3795007.1 hypothetical protein [Actinomyces sp. 217892]